MMRGNGRGRAAILTAETGPLGIPQETAFTTAFWISASAALVGAAVALLITPLRRRESVREPVQVSP